MSEQSQEDADTLREALERFRLVETSEADQRKRELEDLKVASGDQWPEDVKRARLGQGTGGTLPPVPARPCETFNKLLQPLEQVENQFKQARLALKFAPKGDGASKDTAEVFGDIARAIQTDSRAQLARDWAFSRTLRAGRGAYRLLVEYIDDDTDQLEIVYKRILNQASVYYDPYAQEPDWSDARFCLITEDIPLERFRLEYPDSSLSEASDDTLSGIGNQYPGWVVSDGEENRTVRVAEYFYMDYDEEKRPIRPEVRTKDGELMMRSIRRPKVGWCKITAMDVLERNTWAGKYIPIIPMVAREENVNGNRIWTGMVRPAIGAQRSYNYHRNAQIETVGLATRAPYQVDPEQIEGYEEWWKASNTRNFPYLPRKSNDGRGNPYLPIQRNVEEPAIQAITLAAHEADGDLKATTGIFDPSLGNLNPSDRSGKAVLALQKQAELGSSGYLYNVANMSMVLEGKILLDLIPKVYNTPGRIVAAIGEDDQRRNVMLGAPFTQGQGGQPQPAQPGQPGATMIDLSKGAYQVAVEVGKSTTTRREEGATAMSDLAQAAPQLLPTYADIWVGNLDFPGSKQIADRLKKQLPPQLQDQDQSPEAQVMQLQQQTQQAGQLIDMLSKELHAKNAIIETEQVKAQQEMEAKKLDSDTRIQVAWIQASAGLAKEGMAVDAENARSFVDALEQKGAQALQAHMDRLKQHADHLHEAALTAMQQAHERATMGAQATIDQQAQDSAQQHQAGLQADQNAAQADLQQQQAEQPASSGVE
jgi:hypothetical protein